MAFQSKLKCLVWSRRVSDGRFREQHGALDSAHALSSSAPLLHPSLTPMTALVLEGAITTVCWVGLAIFIPVSSIRGQSWNSRVELRFRLGMPVPLLPNTAASSVSNDQNHSESEVCVRVCMCLTWKLFWEFCWKWTISPERLDSGNSFCADSSLDERCGLSVFVHTDFCDFRGLSSDIYSKIRTHYDMIPRIP